MIYKKPSVTVEYSVAVTNFVTYNAIEHFNQVFKITTCRFIISGNYGLRNCWSVKAVF